MPDAAGASEAWRTLAPLPAGPRQETAVAALDGGVWVLGGFDASGRVVATVEIYDPISDTWRRGPDLPVPMHHANVAVADGTLYIVGFLVGRFIATGQVFSYDKGADAWTERTSMPRGSERGASGVGVVDNKIYVAGGFRSAAVGDFSVYDPQTDSWASLPNAPVPSDHLVAAGIDGIIYTAGGRQSSIAAHRPRLDAFDPSTGVWSQRAPMPASRGGIAGAVLHGRLYVFGGEGNEAQASGVFGNVEAYDPATDSWQVLAAMPTPRHGTGAAAVGEAIYVPGGATVVGFGAVDTNESFTPEG